jgi:hypothetical protein
MKYLKMLGLAAIAAMGLMAFVGAGSASATVLCTTTTTPSCVNSATEVDKYAAGTVIDATLKNGGSATLTSSSGGTIATCTGGTVKGKISNAGSAAATVSGNIESLTWTGCSQTTHTVANGSLEIHHVSGTHNGTVTGNGSQVTVAIFGTSCTYGTGEGTHLGTLTGGTEPILKIATTVSRTAGGFLCPLTAGWDAEYVVTEPHSLFVTAS